MKLYKIKKSDIDKKGRGLYAANNIKEGTKIIDYIGKLITKKKTQDSNKYDNNKPIYLFTINKRYDLDGDFPWNKAGLINHSCDNNCDYDGKGLKMSKSRGTFINARTYLDHLDPEYLRYYFAAKMSAGVDDLDINLDDFVQRVNSDVVGKVVNIASRCAGFINKQFERATRHLYFWTDIKPCKRYTGQKSRCYRSNSRNIKFA